MPHHQPPADPPPGLEARDLPPLLDACHELGLAWHLHVPADDAWKRVASALAHDGATYLAVKVRDETGVVSEVLVWSDVNSGPHPWRRTPAEMVRRELATWLLSRRPNEWFCTDEVKELAEAARKAGS